MNTDNHGVRGSTAACALEACPNAPRSPQRHVVASVVGGKRQVVQHLSGLVVLRIERQRQSASRKQHTVQVPAAQRQ